jgi:rare lipoprotein A
MIKRLSLLAIIPLWTTGFSPEGISTLTASYYASGKITANGEAFHPEGLTAAHRRLPFGTVLKVRNLANNREVVVRINDRGPYVDGRSIDLSLGAAAQLGMIETGLAQVVVTVVEPTLASY